jgi:transcription elongation factor Elf1
MGHYHHNSKMVGAVEVQKRFKLALAGCPFCGFANVNLITTELPHVSCDVCGADGPMAIKAGGMNAFELQTVAINRWNRRP